MLVADSSRHPFASFRLFFASHQTMLFRPVETCKAIIGSYCGELREQNHKTAKRTK